MSITNKERDLLTRICKEQNAGGGAYVDTLSLKLDAAGKGVLASLTKKGLVYGATMRGDYNERVHQVGAMSEAYTLLNIEERE